MITPFRFFAGGPMGSGRQYMSWIHRLDWIEMVRWIVQTPEASGPFNLTAPHPVTNREFARALGRSLKRPALLPAPAFALRIALGEFANYVVTGQRVRPRARAEARVSLPVSGAGYCVQGDFRRLSTSTPNLQGSKFQGIPSANSQAWACGTRAFGS